MYKNVFETENSTSKMCDSFFMNFDNFLLTVSLIVQKVLALVDLMHHFCHLQLDHDLKHAHELRQAAFKLYASLGSNDEDIRKKVTLPLLCFCLHI